MSAVLSCVTSVAFKLFIEAKCSLLHISRYRELRPHHARDQSLYENFYENVYSFNFVIFFSTQNIPLSYGSLEMNLFYLFTFTDYFTIHRLCGKSFFTVEKEL